MEERQGETEARIVWSVTRKRVGGSVVTVHNVVAIIVAAWKNKEERTTVFVCQEDKVSASLRVKSEWKVCKREEKAARVNKPILLGVEKIIAWMFILEEWLLVSNHWSLRYC